MFPRPSLSCPPHRRTPTAVRILALLTLSALLHLLAIDWAGGGLQLPRWHDADVPPVQVELRPAPEPEPVAVAPPKPRPRPKPKARPPRPAPKAIAQAPAPEAPPSPEPAPAVQASPQPDAAPGISGESAAPVADSPAEPPAAESAAPSAPEPPRHVFRMPPSAELKYDVQALREGKIVYGHGKIAWRSNGGGDGGSYLVEGDAGVLFFTLLEFSSRGMVDENGVAPVQYAEKRFRRPETATHFRRDAGLISFSASTATYPRRGGEQDRASIVWQLAAIGRGEPERFRAGAGFDIFVAGVRDGETWTMQVLGLEDIDTGDGRLSAWHVVRVPRPGSYEQKLDIWLAPGRDWYPMRLRWTETSGDYLDMSASSVTPLPTPAPPR